MGDSNATPSRVGKAGMAEGARSARAPIQTEQRVPSQRSAARVETEPTPYTSTSTSNKTKEKRQFFKKLYHKVVEKKEAARYDTVQPQSQPSEPARKSFQGQDAGARPATSRVAAAAKPIHFSTAHARVQSARKAKAEAGSVSRAGLGSVVSGQAGSQRSARQGSRLPVNSRPMTARER